MSAGALAVAFVAFALGHALGTRAATSPLRFAFSSAGVPVVADPDTPERWVLHVTVENAGHRKPLRDIRLYVSARRLGLPPRPLHVPLLEPGMRHTFELIATGPPGSYRLKMRASAIRVFTAKAVVEVALVPWSAEVAKR